MADRNCYFCGRILKQARFDSVTCRMVTEPVDATINVFLDACVCNNCIIKIRDKIKSLLV